MAQEMTTHERITRMYEHRDADRVPVIDYPWGETVDRWVAEGMPTRDWAAHFDLDKTAYIGTDNSPRLPVRVVEETDSYIVQTTPWGVTQRTFKANTTTPEHMAFEIDNPDAWRKAKERMTPSHDRVNWAWLKENYAQWRKEGRWITGGLWFGFDITHSHMVGTDTLLMAMFDDPEWCVDMFNHELDVSMALLESVWQAGYTFDEVHWYDDMGYKGTQFFSMSMYRELLKPVHQRAIDWGHSHGCKVRMHSCGNVMPYVPELIGMGLDALNPLEVKAGMDPIGIKRDYGDKLVLHGGIDVVKWENPEQLEAEIRRLVPVLKENGGYIFASDHSIPPYISYEAFCRVVKLIKEVSAYN